jgi:hypothetical protein
MDCPVDDLSTPLGNRVVVLVESPLSERDADRFGIRAMTTLGLNVEVWEVAPLTLPKSELQAIERPADVKIQRVENALDLEELCGSLHEGDTAIFILGIYRGDIERCMPVVQAVSSSRATLGAVLGSSPWSKTELSPAYAEEWSSRKFAYLRLRYFLATRFRRTIAGLMNLPGVRALRRHRRGVRALDLVWVATSRRPIDPLFIGPRTVTRFIHTFDFDLVRSLVDAPVDRPGEIAYIDGLGPLHPDNVTLETGLPESAIDTYFGNLRIAFDWIEGVTGMPVIVAAHPRARPGSLESLYGNRKVVYSATAGAIRDCDVVLMSYASNSVAFVVALRKPAAYVYSTSEFRYERAMRRDLLRRLELDALCLEDLPEGFGIPIPNANAYSHFFRRHIKKPGTPDKSFWDVVATDVLSLQTSAPPLA